MANPIGGLQNSFSGAKCAYFIHKSHLQRYKNNTEINS